MGAPMIFICSLRVSISTLMWDLSATSVAYLCVERRRNGRGEAERAIDVNVAIAEIFDACMVRKLVDCLR